MNSNMLVYFIPARRLENEVKEILDDIGQDQDKKKELIKGRQVDLAEELSKQSTIMNFTSHLMLFGSRFQT